MLCIDKSHIFIDKISSVMENFSFRGGSVSVISDCILMIEYNQTKTITVRDLYELSVLREQLIGKNNYHTVTELRKGYINFTDDAKAFIAENDSNGLRLSDSILVDSFAKRIEVELYIRFHKPKVKTKVFTDLNKALNWIENVNKTYQTNCVN